MPNWCSTTYEITGKKKDIDKLWSAIEEAQTNAKIETDFGSEWLGHFLSYLGMSEEEVCRGPVRCRGYITYKNHDGDGSIVIDTDTAWGPMPEPILMMVEEYAPDAKIIYTAIEHGCGIFETNDRSVANGCLIDVWEADKVPKELEGYDYDVISEKKITKLLRKLLGKNASLKELLKDAEEKWGEYVSFNQFEYRDILDLIC